MELVKYGETEKVERERKRKNNMPTRKIKITDLNFQLDLNVQKNFFEIKKFDENRCFGIFHTIIEFDVCILLLLFYNKNEMKTIKIEGKILKKALILSCVDIFCVYKTE